MRLIFFIISIVGVLFCVDVNARGDIVDMLSLCSEACVGCPSVVPAPDDSVAQNDGPYCVGDTIHLKANVDGSHTYLWRDPHYNPISEEQNPIIPNAQTKNAGTYTLVVDNDFFNSYTTEVVVNELPPLIGVSSDGTDFANGVIFCEGVPIHLYTEGNFQSEMSFFWQGPGITPDLETLRDVTILNSSLNDSGQYIIKVTDVVTGCFDIDTLKLYMSEKPTLEQISENSNAQICIGESIRDIVYQWGGSADSVNITWLLPGAPDGVSVDINGNLIKISGLPANPNNYRCNIKTQGEYSPCGDVVKRPKITVEQMPELELQSDIALTQQELCQNSPIHPIEYSFAGSATGVDVLNLPDGVDFDIDYNNNTVTISGVPDESGTIEYDIETTGSSYCESKYASGLLIIKENPKASAPDDFTCCEGDTIKLTSADGGSTYTWSGPGNFSSNYQNVMIFNADPNMNGDYYINVGRQNGCVSTDVTRVSVVPNPIVEIAQPSDVCPNTTYDFVGTLTTPTTGPYTFSWSSPDNITFDNPVVTQDETTHTVNATIPAGCDRHYIITLTVEDNYHCGTGETSVSFNVNDAMNPEITLPPNPTFYGCSLADLPPAATDLSTLPDGTTVTDNCTNENLTIQSEDLILDEGCPILVERSYTVEDICGNKSPVARYVISISDTTRPAITGSLPDTLVIGCDDSTRPLVANSVAELEQLGAANALAIDDDCTPKDALVVTHSDSEPSGTCPIVITRTYTITDKCSNSNTLTQLINIHDTVPPTINGTLPTLTVAGCTADDRPPAVTSVADLEDMGAATDLEIADNCTDDQHLVVTATDGEATGKCPIIIMRTYTVTDECLNTNSVTQEIRINDTAAPKITGTLADIEIEGCLPDDIAAVPPMTTVAELEGANLDISDNCTEDAQLIVTSADGEPKEACPIIIVRTYTVTDDCGNLDTVKQNIRIGDHTPPTIEGSLPTISLIGCSASDVLPTAMSTVAELEADGLSISDNCTSDANLAVTHDDNINDGCPIIVTRTYTITDECSNHATISQTIEIHRGDFTVPDAAEQTVHCPVEVNGSFTLPVVKDTCNEVLTPSDPVVSEMPECNGSVVYTYTYTDCEGHSHDWTYTYHIDMPAGITMNPSTGGDTTVNCYADIEAPTLPNVTDACGRPLTPESTTIDPPTAPECNGDVTYTYKYRDCAGHEATWTRVFHIQMPTFTLPPDDTMQIACEIDTTTPTLPNVTDSCHRTLIPSAPNVVSNVVNGAGEVIYTFTYTDCAGHSADWHFVYKVTPDDFDPYPNAHSTISCLTQAIEPTTPIIRNCGDTAILTLAPDSPVTNVVDGCGTVVYTYNYVINGNPYEWIFTYTVSPADFTIAAEPGTDTVGCFDEAIAPTSLPVVSDVCGRVLTAVQTADSPVVDTVCHGHGTVKWIYRYTDCANNYHDWTFTYVIDMQDFTIPDVANSETVDCASQAVPPTDKLPAVHDACGRTLLPIDEPTVSETPECNGDIIYTYTYSDCNGHSHDWTYTYTIEMPAGITMDPSTGGDTTVNCYADIEAPTLPDVTDACGRPLTPVDTIIEPSTAPECNGDVTYTYKYRDCAGHEATWARVFHIRMAAFTLPPDGTMQIACEIDTTTPTLPNVTDSCHRTLIPSAPHIVSNVVNGSGTVTYTFHYTDCAGHSADWHFIYIVIPGLFTPADDQDSTISCLTQAIEPTTPIIRNCGDTAILTLATNSPDTTVVNGCGTVVYTYNYVINGNPYEWHFTYNVSPDDFVIAAEPGTATVNTIAEAVEPDATLLPTVTDACGRILTPSDAIVGGTFVTCSGTRTYTYVYNDCTGNHQHEWTYTYNIDPPLPVVNLGPDQTVCIGDSVTLNSGNPASYTHQWSTFDSGVSIVKPVGTYALTVTDDNQCQAVDTITISNFAPTTLSFDVTPESGTGNADGAATVIPNGTPEFTYHWDIDSVTASISHVAGGMYCVTVIDGNGCETSACVSISNSQTPPVADFSADRVVICEGDTVSFTDLSLNFVNQWNWEFEGGNPATSNTQNPRVVYAHAGDYMVTLRVRNADSEDVEQRTAYIRVNPNPVPTLSNGSPFCVGDDITFAADAGPDIDYQWSNDNGFSAATGNVSIHSAALSDTGVYTVVMTNQNTHCSASANVAIVVNPNPVVEITPPTQPLCPSSMPEFVGTITTSTTGNYVFTWGGDLTFTTPSTPQPELVDNVSVALPETCNVDYNVTLHVVDGNNCAADAPPVLVHVDDTEPPTIVNSLPELSVMGCAATDAPAAMTNIAQLEAAGLVIADNCTPLSQLSVSHADDSTNICPIVVKRTYTITDNCLNFNTLEQRIVIGQDDFDMPADAGSQVPCFAAAAAPDLPAVVDNCNVPISPNLPPAIEVDTTCHGSGTVRYTYTYEDCAGHSHPWVYTYNIMMPDFTIPMVVDRDTVLTVDEAVPPADALMPVVVDACGKTLKPGPHDVGGDYVKCSGTMIYTYPYTDCVGHVHYWTYTYVISPEPLHATVTDIENQLCEVHGSAKATVTGGTTPYFYRWLTSPEQTTQVATNLVSGSYTVSVTDAKGCETTATATLIDEGKMRVTAVVADNVRCYGESNGSIRLTMTDGATDYEIDYGTGSCVANADVYTIENLTAGSYVVNVTDANGCTDAATVAVGEPTLLTLALEATPPACNGDDVPLNIIAGGGTPPYNYLWDNSSVPIPSTSTIVRPTADTTYTVRVEDGHGCIARANAPVNVPAVLTATISEAVDQLCETLGHAKVVANGGISPYTYNWNTTPPQSTDLATDLQAGDYTVTITDFHNCRATANVHIDGDAGAMSISIVPPPPLCHGDLVTLDTHAGGGTTPYTYTWDNGIGTVSNPSVTVQPDVNTIYNVTVTDMNDCTAKTSYMVIMPPPLVANVGDIVNQICATPGSATVHATGGTRPYYFAWSGGDVTDSTSMILRAGELYTITVTDDHNCVTTATVTVSDIGAMTSSTTVLANNLCYGDNDGSIRVDVSDGTPNYTINYGESSDVTASNPYVITGLPAGRYNVEVTDAHGCYHVTTQTITQPTPLVTRVVQGPAIKCFGGTTSATSKVYGGVPPYEHAWYDADGQPADSTQLHAGNCHLVIIDSNGCPDTTVVAIHQPDPIGIDDVVSAILCPGGSDGSITITATGGTPPYEYQWNYGSRYTSSARAITGLIAGEYSLHIVDKNACEKDTVYNMVAPEALSAMYTIGHPSCIGNNDGFIELQVDGGTRPYSFEWENGFSLSDTIVALRQGEYDITITDANKCRYKPDKIVLVDTHVDCIDIPNAFTPNGDDINDVWLIENIDMFPQAQLMVFNRWGQPLWKATGEDDPWDGRYNGHPVPTGSYLYVVELFNGQKPYTGTVTVVY